MTEEFSKWTTVRNILSVRGLLEFVYMNHEFERTTPCPLAVRVLPRGVRIPGPVLVPASHRVQRRPARPVSSCKVG